MDSNHRSEDATDLQSAPIGHSGTLPYSINGAGGRIRTPDLLITNQLLYQLSYTSVFAGFVCLSDVIYIITIHCHLSTVFFNFLGPGNGTIRRYILVGGSVSLWGWALRDFSF